MIKQLRQRDCSSGVYDNIFPVTVLKAVKGGNGKTLADLLDDLESRLSALEGGTTYEDDDDDEEDTDSDLDEDLFTVSVTASTSNYLFQGEDDTITFTLRATYDGTAVDLDSVPSGWTRARTGTYTKTQTITKETESNLSSGSVSCTYEGMTKTASAATCVVVKWSYAFGSSATSIDDCDEIAELFANATDEDALAELDVTILNETTTQSNDITGTHEVTTDKGEYVYFCISPTSEIDSITQMGLSFIDSDYKESYSDDAYGTYTIYRSTVTMGAVTQSIVIA